MIVSNISFTLPRETEAKIEMTAGRLDKAYGGCGNDKKAIAVELRQIALRAAAAYDPAKSSLTRKAFVGIALQNAERHAADRLRREQAKRKLTVTLDDLTLATGAGGDMPITRLPPSCATSARSLTRRLEIRDWILTHAEGWTTTELNIVTLLLAGHSPRAVFTTLGLPPSSAYREYGLLIESVKEALRHE